MSDRPQPGNRWRHLFIWGVVASAVSVLIVLVAAAAVFGYFLWTFRGPDPQLEQLEPERVLVPPIAAVEIARETRESTGGFGSPASITVAYQVDVTGGEALDAWQAAYDRYYHFYRQETLLFGETEHLDVSVEVWDHVPEWVAEARPDVPLVGSTIVTVSVAGVPEGSR